MTWIKVVVINLIVALFFLAFIEMGFRLNERHLAREYAVINENPKNFRLTRPEPYKNSIFFSREFIEESFRQPEGYFTPSGTRLVYPNNFHGNWFNYENHQRITVGQPAIYKSRILLFGGSTVQNSEVPDDSTVASFMQKRVSRNHIRVENYGVTSVHSGQQLERLKRDIKLNKYDTVIFYDGVNDVLQRAYYGNPEGWIVDEVARAPKIAKIVRGYAEYLAILRWIDKNFVTKKFEYNSLLAERSANDYVDQIEKARIYVESHGAKFLHFLQPTLFTKNQKNKYEKQLANASPQGLQLVFDTTYPLIRKKLSSNSEDLSDVFNGMYLSPYLDFCHINEVGNEKIASSILDAIGKNYFLEAF